MGKHHTVVGLFMDVAGRWVWSMIIQIVGFVGLLTLARSEFLPVQYQTYTLGWLLSKWYLWVIGFLVLNFIVMAHRYHAYYTRIMKEFAAEWGDRAEHVRRIGAYAFAGHKLHQKAADPGYRMNRNFMAEVDDWRKGADSALHQLSETHRDAFYKNSVCLQETPDENQFARWIPERLAALNRTLEEVQALPEQLRPYSGREKFLNVPNVSGQS